jgi:hypothetical protein
MKTKQEMLPVRITEPEIVAKAAEHAAKQFELENLKNHNKDLKREMKEDEDKLAIKLLHLARIVDRGEDDRLVDVHETPSVSERMIYVVRLDTGEQIRARGMTASELQEAQQERLPLEAPRKQRAPAVKLVADAGEAD